MATKQEIDPATLLSQAVPPGHWRFVGDEEMPAAVAALAQVVGKAQAKLPSWQRRLAVGRDGKTFLAVVEDCLWKDPNCIAGWCDTDGNGTMGTPTALPIEAASALLAHPTRNPERELLRRRKLAAEIEAKETAKREAKKRADEEAAAAKKKLAAERAQYHAAAWAGLPAHARALLRFALAVAEREPEFAADLRLAVAASLRESDSADFPRAPWWEGIDLTAIPKTLTVEEEHIRTVLSTIPSDRMIILRALHGPDNAAIAQHWTRITEQRGA